LPVIGMIAGNGSSPTVFLVLGVFCLAALYPVLLLWGRLERSGSSIAA
jgi:hypothetical protein